MMAMDSNDMSIINNLPPELKLEILLRLPIKSLLVLKCVSKTWLHLISDPTFAKSHLETATTPITRCLHIQGYNVLSYNLDALIHNGHATDTLSLPWTNHKDIIATVYVMGSCRGFVLLEQHPNLIVWNPSTGEHKQISYSHLDSVYDSHWSCLLQNTYLRGFGYDASKDDYLIVWAWNDNRKNKDHIDFFSLRSNSWESFDFDIPKHWIIYDRTRSGIFLNGAIHWCALPYHYLGFYYIAVFDLIKRCFSEIPIPKHVSILGTLYLLDMRGCLALYFLNKERKYEIWVMKEYKVESSWTLYGLFSWKAFDLLGFSGDGDVVIGFDGNFVGFDIKAREISRYNISGYKHSSFRCSCRNIVYRETLMSLPTENFKI